MARKNNLKDKANTNGFDKNPENINRTGANRKPISALLKELTDNKIADLEITLTTESGKKRTKKINLKSKTSFKEAINIILLQKALSGDLGAIKEINDRTEGKALQKMEVSNTNETLQEIDLTKLSDAEIKQLIKLNKKANATK